MTRRDNIDNANKILLNANITSSTSAHFEQKESKLTRQGYLLSYNPVIRRANFERRWPQRHAVVRRSCGTNSLMTFSDWHSQSCYLCGHLVPLTLQRAICSSWDTQWMLFTFHLSPPLTPEVQASIRATKATMTTAIFTDTRLPGQARYACHNLSACQCAREKWHPPHNLPKPLQIPPPPVRVTS
jgi:hypothetical protein